MSTVTVTRKQATHNRSVVNNGVIVHSTYVSHDVVFQGVKFMVLRSLQTVIMADGYRGKMETVSVWHDVNGQVSDELPARCSYRYKFRSDQH